MTLHRLLLNSLLGTMHHQRNKELYFASPAMLLTGSLKTAAMGSDTKQTSPIR